MPKKPKSRCFERRNKKPAQGNLLNQEETSSSNNQTLEDDQTDDLSNGDESICGNVPLPQTEVLLAASVDHSYCFKTEDDTVETIVTSHTVFSDELTLSNLDDVEGNCSEVVDILLPEHIVSLPEAEVHGHDQPLPDQENSSTCTLYQEICEESVSHLKEKLPPLWKFLEDKANMLTLLKFSNERYHVLQRTLHFDRDFNVTASFHGKQLLAGHQFYRDLTELKVQSNLPRDLVTAVCIVVACYGQFEVCVGIHDPQFNSFALKDEACIRDENNFEETRYTATWRSKQCLYAVPRTQLKCLECAKIIRKFARRQSFKNPNLSPSGRLKTPNRFTNFKNLSTAEKQSRIDRFRKDIRNLKLANHRLQEKIVVLQDLLQKEGVDVDEDLSENLSNCFEEANQASKLTDFHKLFLQQQMKAAQVKGATGMRWHPLMIRFALQIKMASSVAYATMAQSGFLKLPGLRTLFDYTSAMAVTEGLHRSVIEDVANAVGGMEHEYQRFHVLIFDEVAVCQGLVQKKTTGEVVGYCSLDKVKEEIMNLEKHVVEVAQELTPQPLACPPMVKKILSFMVKGTASNVQSVVASYGVSLLTKEDLHCHAWDVIEILEMSGIFVISIVCDGSPINRGFINMQPPYSQDSQVVYDTVNHYAPDRLIYFISDPPHLIKTIRNCLYNSGKKQCRTMRKNSQDMCWSTIIALFKLKSKQTVKKLHKLTAPCVFLNSYSRMKVAFAVRVISKSVSEVLDDLKWPGTSELCVFEKI